MRLRFRGWLIGMVGGLLACAVVGIGAASASAASFNAEKFVAANCKSGAQNEKCGEETKTAESPVKPGETLEYSFPKEPTLAEAEAAGYTQAAGHPAVGITAFKVDTVGTFPEEVPTGVVTHVRTDVAPGVSTNPEAVAKCTTEEFGAEVVPGSGFFAPPKCVAGSEIGLNKVVVAIEPAPGHFYDVPLTGTVYNLVQPNGLSSLFGVALDLTNVGHPGIFAHTLIEGHVEWGTDYHDYYEINVSPLLPVIASRLALNGDIGTTSNGGFITNSSNCAGPGPLTTNTVALESQTGEKGARQYTAPIGPEGCKGEKGLLVPPFEPGFKLSTETTQSDAPDGITTEATLQHDPSPTGIDNSQLKTASFTLPEGMTLNPSAAAGLEACSSAQIGIKTRNAVTCPEKSRLGSATLIVPDLPATEPLEGSRLPRRRPHDHQTAVHDLYRRRVCSIRRLSAPGRHGHPDEKTGQVTTIFKENPEQPFSKLTLKFNGQALAPIANPLTCGPATTSASFSPYTEAPLSVSPPVQPFTVDSNGGACASPLPFSLAQTTASAPTTGGSATNFTLNVSRADGQQYLAKMSAALPIGLVGKIPAVPLCPEPHASLGPAPRKARSARSARPPAPAPPRFASTGRSISRVPPTGRPTG